MRNATSTIEEVRFDLRDEQITHVYVLSRADGDAPIGVQGWHYKAFPARIPMVEILTPRYISDYLLWPLKAPEIEDALAIVGKLVIEQYTERDKGSAVEDVDLTQIATQEAAAAAARWRERAEAAEAQLERLRREHEQLLSDYLPGFRR